VHPSIARTAEAWFRSAFLRSDATGTKPKPKVDLASLPPFRAITHSYGSAAVVQLISYAKRRAREVGIAESVDRYFSKGVCVQIGGYRLWDLPTESAPSYHCVISPLDEIALGSPGSPPRYTSPLELPAAVWTRFTKDELARILEGEHSHIPVNRLSIKPGVELWSPVLPGFHAYDDDLKPVAILENANGHFLSAYVDCIVSRIPEIGRTLA